MYLCGIFERNDGAYYWLDEMTEEEVREAKYFVSGETGYHVCEKSALYDDMTGYVDQLQREEHLKDDELYVVCYYWTDCPYCMRQEVDFGITKQEIIENVKAQKYVEGASYYTVGQMFYMTRMVMEEQ